ncbi:rhodanese-like domain-containing protein [Sulfitobacter sp. S190]|uniref:rhodanese-like domain-containing protein n=1 Tax=Sulfitobacter sp. S190 TaxID=2867022 RepID=UPI0021A67D55|nr:rhodanese-like domain-containing protein [Sulfitobacter sp. S190]UWR21647.1 rhodanese-like domain-containing protein [Sulfitobacter sp. S190]
MASGSPSPGAEGPRRVLTRRGALALGLVAAGTVAAWQWFNIGASTDEGLSVQAAHAAAVAGDITLIDIRRPDEWSRTGIGEGAVPLDMRRDDFTETLLSRVSGRMDAPVALICARGVRSRGLTAKLTAAGFTRIIDVPEGMLGSGAGPGWIKAGLPVRDI